MKYESDLLAEIIANRGHNKSSIHYESECIEAFIEEYKGSYPKLCDYESEWLNYIVKNPIGVFPYETITDVTEATINNVVPFEFKSAILKGNTGYRDIDTGEILETFEDGRNLELVSVKMPVLKTTGKNLINILEQGYISNIGNNVDDYPEMYTRTDFIKLKKDKQYIFSDNGNKRSFHLFVYDLNKNFIQNIGMANTYTPQSDCFIRLFQMDNISNALYQVEENSVITTYEPHKSNILTVNEPVELRGIGDVQDTLDCLTGEVTERIGEVVLDGSQNLDIQFNTNSQQPNTAFVQYADSRFEKGEAISCDLPKANVDLWGVSSYDNHFVFNYKYYTDINKKIQVLIPYSMLKTINISGVKQFLSENPIKILLPIKESVKTVDLTIIDQNGQTVSKLKPIEGTMHMETNGEPLKPLLSAEVPVEAITQNLNSFIEGD